MTSKKVLFISHEASRTGAPILLLQFLKWLKANSEIPFHILLKKGGAMEAEFGALAPVSVFNRNLQDGNFFQKAIRRLPFERSIRRIHLHNLKQKLIQDNIGIIYSNTITNGEVLEFLSSLKCPVITHIHELEYNIRRCGLENLELVQLHSDQYIVVSKAVKNNLQQNHGIPEDRIDLIYGFIPTQSGGLSNNHLTRTRIREELCIEQNVMIVGACGTTDWRKGADLFIQLARAVYHRHPGTPVHFVWVGGENQGPRFHELWHDVENAGLCDYIHFVGVQENPLDFFEAFDVFTLVSREDPFPLVCLEAASVGKPIVCFDGSGGMKEFVEDDCGFIVPYLDIEMMAIKTLELLKSTELRQRLGKRATQKVKNRHDVSVAAPKILEVIERYL